MNLTIGRDRLNSMDDQALESNKNRQNVRLEGGDTKKQLEDKLLADQEPSKKKYRSGVDFIIDEREEIDRDNRK